MQHFNIKGVIGKGGMGAKTLQGCVDTPGVYFHAVGGAATFLAQTVQNVLGVYKLEEFGVPEAMWVIEVKNFPVVVTMDAHGQSKHSLLDDSSGKILEELLSRPY
jgi:fumarate hydratase class I